MVHSPGHPIIQSEQQFIDLTDEWDITNDDKVEQKPPADEVDEDMELLCVRKKKERPEFDILETEVLNDDYGDKGHAMNDSMVEQLTVPADSSEFHLKQKRFKMVNSGLVKTAATNHGIMSDNKD